MPKDLSLGQFLTGILPRLSADTTMPVWPPDCFALCLSVLKRTGAYMRIFSRWPPDANAGDDLANWVDETRRIGTEWRKCWNSGKDYTLLDREWRIVEESFALQLGQVADRPDLWGALIRIVAVADEASESVGAPLGESDQDEGEPPDVLLDRAAELLQQFGTLCDEVDPARLRVLPRMHTPQSGFTDRSLSLYLSLHDACEVIPEWISRPFLQRESFNLLLIPWPFEILVKQFREVAESAASLLPDEFGFFTFDVEDDPSFVNRILALHKEAKRRLGRIDGIVLPELAVSPGQFAGLRLQLPLDCFLVSGVAGAASQPERGTNEVRIGFPGSEVIAQKKHHPWKLNDSQIVQYGLGGVLSPSKGWWEYADFTDRRLCFIAFSPDLVLTVLICEDLARPDPAANLIRSVGPNLVIALLMDGPQTRERWAARYATVLADDPGCSVLSLTSKGMAQMSSPVAGLNRSRVIALWKDAFGPAREIELPDSFEAIAISLSTRYEEVFTADGRGDEGNAAYLTLSGVHPIRAKTEES